MLKHKTGLRKIIEKRISKGMNYMEILKTTYGADPREVWKIYKHYQQNKHPPQNPPKKTGLTNLYPKLPEPHPAYSQWRITPKSTKTILSKIINKDYKKICFLGCPVLGIEFSNLSQNKCIILDIDKNILDYVKEPVETKLYNINTNLPDRLKKQFECVVCDPPWYNKDIKLFIKRAAELTKIGGTIYLSLPSLLTKPSLPQKRLELQKWLSKSGLIISEISQIAEYEAPPFEYMAYQDIPEFTGEIWRKGDWIKLKKTKNCKIKAKKISYNKWLEYTLNKKRIFLKEKTNKKKYEKPKLNRLYPDKSLILKSVSKRNPLIPKIDIWTSRNGILHLKKGYSIIKTILENIHKPNNKIIEIISKKYKKEIKIVKFDCIKPINQIRNLINL